MLKLSGPVAAPPECKAGTFAVTLDGPLAEEWSQIGRLLQFAGTLLHRPLQVGQCDGSQDLQMCWCLCPLHFLAAATWLRIARGFFA